MIDFDLYTFISNVTMRHPNPRSDQIFLTSTFPVILGGFIKIFERTHCNLFIKFNQVDLRTNALLKIAKRMTWLSWFLVYINGNYFNVPNTIIAIIVNQSLFFIKKNRLPLYLTTCRLNHSLLYRTVWVWFQFSFVTHPLKYVLSNRSHYLVCHARKDFRHTQPEDNSILQFDVICNYEKTPETIV